MATFISHGPVGIDMAETVAYLDTGDNATVELKHRGITLAIYKSHHAVGPLFVTKTGIRWLPKGRHWVRKGRKVVGTLVSWEELDEKARGGSNANP